MNLNKIGIDVKKNVNGALSTLSAIITNSANRQLKPQIKVKLTESIYSDRELDEILHEAEVKKNQAIMIIHNIQNR